MVVGLLFKVSFPRRPAKPGSDLAHRFPPRMIDATIRIRRDVFSSAHRVQIFNTTFVHPFE
jgi:hypothetical protein